MSPRVVSVAEWLAARKELQAAEEEAVRALWPGRQRRSPGPPACPQHHVRGGIPGADQQDRAIPAADGVALPVVFVAGKRLTWSGYGPVIDLLCGTDIRLDLTPLGRQDENVELLHHDKYP